MYKYKHFFGIDVSKNHLDICLISEDEIVFNKRIDNTKSGWRKFIQSTKKEYKINLKDSLFCLETTGNYSNPSLYYLHSIKASVWLEMPIQIKNSQGFKRGKNDKVDAERIAIYALTFQHNFKNWTPPRKEILQLKTLASLRDKLVKNIGKYSSPLSDLNFIQDVELKKIQKRMSASIIQKLKKEKKIIEDKIKEIIKLDPELKRLFKIVLSVDGIGINTALDMVVYTNEFKTISSPKKFACYAGVAPFETSSGKSIHGKNRLSNFANKNSKRLLHMAAMSAVVMKGELREYYLKRTENGKPKMVVLNAVRNKLIQRVFACVKNNKIYEKEYVYSS